MTYTMKIAKLALAGSMLAILPGCVVWDIKDGIEGSNANLVEIQNGLSYINTQLVDVNANLSEVDARLDSMDAQLQSLQTQLDATNDHLNSLRKTISSIDKTIPFLSISGDDDEEENVDAQAEPTTDSKTDVEPGGK